MTTAAFPTNVTMVPTESHKTNHVRAGVQSSVRSACIALAEADGFLGRGFPPGPVAWVVGGITASLDAVIMLWSVNATRKIASKMIGEEKRM